MNNKDLGLFLKELRIKKELTQKELAEILIVTPQTISKWELGISTPSLEMLLTLSNLYNITVDEIIKGSLSEENKAIVIKEKRGINAVRIMLYVIYVLMIAIGITINFVDYINVDISFLEYEIFNTSLPYDRPPIGVNVELTSWFMLSLGIFLPVLLTVLHIVDKKKFFLLGATILSVFILLAYQLTIIAAPIFIGTEIGLVLHIGYTLLCVSTIILILASLNVDYYKIAKKRSREIFSTVGMILCTVLLPFAFVSGGDYFFSITEQILFVFMLWQAVFVLFKRDKELEFVINILSVVLFLGLIYSTIVYIFHSGLIIGSLVMYLYLVFLGLSYSETKIKSYDYRRLLKFDILIVEIGSLIVYAYLFIRNGDLFFTDSHIVHIKDLAVGNFVSLNIILLAIGMFFRMVKYKTISRFFYTFWGLWQGYFLYTLYRDYIKVPGFHMSDGLFLFIPIVLLVIYIIIYLLNLAS